MKKYEHKKIEQKWKKNWEKNKLYKTGESVARPKFYVLDMFPYPSGAGLHVGHPKGYIATDVIARMKMMQGYNVLHPMGWDAFGLPAENYAIKNKVHPSTAVKKNIATFKKQLGLLGFTYDWDREINTTDPEYYRFTQWIFLEMFKKGLAYESYEPINWCPSCQTGLANEDLEDGKCERCGSEIEHKPMRQWVLRITDYADRLLKDLDGLTAWPEPIKEMQRNWIGKSEGAIVRFSVIARSVATWQSHSQSYSQSSMEDEGIATPRLGEARNDNLVLEVFTTRPDTLFGSTYCVVAPEHQIINNEQLTINNRDEVVRYLDQAKKKSDLERTDLAKEKTGVELKGIKAVNPVNGEELPIFVADYVLTGYGTGAIMAVPAHDERDFEFAKKYNLPIKQVVKQLTINNEQLTKKSECFAGDGEAINSDFINGLPTSEAKKKIIAWLEEKKMGQKKIQYKLRDWVFSRQRYWGEPIPLIFCEECKKTMPSGPQMTATPSSLPLSKGEKLNPGWFAVDEKDLPVELPKVKSYAPTGTGESPLADITKWVNTKCPKCGGPAKRETNTMPQWAGSCWYYLAYCMRGGKRLKVKGKRYNWDKENINYWNPVDLYVGGAEHATRHLIYARFWHKFLFDIGAVKYDEPFIRLQNVGLILAEDGRKMSKRWGNVINPDDIVKEFGADAMRLYEMFMGPFDQPCAWNTQGLVGMRRFLEKVWGLREKVTQGVIPAKAGIQKDKGIATSSATPRNDRLLHQTIKKVSDDIEAMRYNTAISQLMILVNEMSRSENLISTTHYSLLLKLLSPFAPHIAEELWAGLGNKKSIFQSEWPKYDPQLILEKEITLAVQVNGKLRDTIVVPADVSEEKAKETALNTEKIQAWLAGKEPKKVIYVKGKLVSIVV